MTEPQHWCTLSVCLVGRTAAVTATSIHHLSVSRLRCHVRADEAEQDVRTGKLGMLPTDMALTTDPVFRCGSNPSKP